MYCLKLQNRRKYQVIYEVKVGVKQILLAEIAVGYFLTTKKKFWCPLKVKLSLDLLKHCVMKTYGEWRYSSTILDLGTRWRWMVSITPRQLYLQRNNPRYPLYRRLRGPQNRSKCNGEQKNILPLRAIEFLPLCRPACLSLLLSQIMKQ
jgi:hypothetical protein